MGGKYNNNAQLRKFELRKQRRNGKWRRKLHKAENELKHHKARERELIIAFKNARMRVVGLLAKVSTEDAREIKNLKQGTLQAMRAGHRKMWRSISRFIAQQAEKLHQLITVQRRYLLELHHIEKQQSTLLILLRKRNVGTSRALQHVLQRRVQWLREIRKRTKTFKRMMKYLSRKMRNEKHKAINRMRMTNLRGSRRFRKMVLHKRQNFRAAATKESHVVFKLRKAWLRLHKALQRCRRMMRMHVTLRKSGQAKRAQRLSQETRRLTMLLHKEEEKDSLLLKHQRLWTSERVRKWRVKLIKQMKKAHEVTTALDLQIKSAKFEKNREKKASHRYKDRLENIEYHVNALRRERVLLAKMIETTAREIKKDTTPALMLKTVSTRLSKIEASLRKLVGDDRAKLVKGVQAEHNNRREVPKKGFGLNVRFEKKRWDALSHDLALVRKELGKSLQQHRNQLKLLNQLRHERLLKSEVVEKLKKIGSELRIIHIKLAKVHNRRAKRYQLDEERARHLLLHESTEYKHLLSTMLSRKLEESKLLRRTKNIRARVDNILRKFEVVKGRWSEVKRRVSLAHRKLGRLVKRFRLWRRERRGSLQKLSLGQEKIDDEFRRRRRIKYELGKVRHDISEKRRLLAMLTKKRVSHSRRFNMEIQALKKKAFRGIMWQHKLGLKAVAEKDRMLHIVQKLVRARREIRGLTDGSNANRR